MFRRVIPLGFLSLWACDFSIGPAPDLLQPAEPPADTPAAESPTEIQDPVTLAVLSLVNDPDVGVEELDHGVRLDRRAAEQLVLTRDGPDGLPDTEDDRMFRSLAEVDSIPWIGSASIQKLYDYAVQYGYLATYRPPAAIQLPSVEGVGYNATAFREVLNAARITDADAVLTRALLTFDGGDRFLDREELSAAAFSCRDDIYDIDGYRWAERQVEAIMVHFGIEDRLALLAQGTAHDADENRYLARPELERAMVTLLRE